MLTKKDIENLANLARIKVTLGEEESLASEMDSILEYVGKIKEVAGERGDLIPILKNVLRDDEVTTKAGEYTEALLSLAPGREKNYLKVKKILE